MVDAEWVETNVGAGLELDVVKDVSPYVLPDTGGGNVVLTDCAVAVSAAVVIDIVKPSMTEVDSTIICVSVDKGLPPTPGSSPIEFPKPMPADPPMTGRLYDISLSRFKRGKSSILFAVDKCLRLPRVVSTLSGNSPPREKRLMYMVDPA